MGEAAGGKQGGQKLQFVFNQVIFLVTAMSSIFAICSGRFVSPGVLAVSPVGVLSPTPYLTTLFISARPVSTNTRRPAEPLPPSYDVTLCCFRHYARFCGGRGGKPRPQTSPHFTPSWSSMQTHYPAMQRPGGRPPLIWTLIFPTGDPREIGQVLTASLSIRALPDVSVTSARPLGVGGAP